MFTWLVWCEMMQLISIRRSLGIARGCDVGDLNQLLLFKHLPSTVYRLYTKLLPSKKATLRALVEAWKSSKILRCPNRWRSQIQPTSDLKSHRFQIAAISVANSTLIVNRCRGDSAATLRSALRFQIARFPCVWNCCDCDFAIWASKSKTPSKNTLLRTVSSLASTF